LSDLKTRSHASVIITSIILAGQSHADLNPSITECNARLERLAASRGAVYVDINPQLCSEGILSAAYSNDGVHLNGEGYKQVCSVLTPYLNRYRPNKSPEPTAVGAVSSAVAVHVAVGGGSAFYVRPL
jgi:lysophospholipase L1-like esterase